MAKPIAATLPQPLRVGMETKNIALNLVALSSHVNRINENENPAEQPWSGTHMEGFLQGTKKSELMALLTKLGFTCGPTDAQDQTTYQHPEVERNAIRVPFTGTTNTPADRSLIEQAARAISQYATNQYNVWNPKPATEKPGEAEREVTQAMLAGALA